MQSQGAHSRRSVLFASLDFREFEIFVGGGSELQNDITSRKNTSSCHSSGIFGELFVVSTSTGPLISSPGCHSASSFWLLTFRGLSTLRSAAVPHTMIDAIVPADAVQSFLNL